MEMPLEMRAKQASIYILLEHVCTDLRSQAKVRDRESAVPCNLECSPCICRPICPMLDTNVVY